MAKKQKRVFVIHERIWADERFRQLWDRRYDKAVPMPNSWATAWPGMERDPRSIDAKRMKKRFVSRRKRAFTDVVETLGGTCLACGVSPATVVDHVLPICWGGTNDIWNLQPLCHSCNSAKSGTLPTPPAGQEGDRG